MHEQIVFAGNHEIGASGQSTGEHGVIVDFALNAPTESACRHGSGQPLADGQDSCGRQSGGDDSLGELFLGQRGGQFIEQGSARQKLKFFLAGKFDDSP